MKVVLQTVNEGSVTIDGKLISKIGRGFLLLVGFTDGDSKEIVDMMVDKILKLRVFSDENGQTNLGLDDVHGQILSVSQFTLYADTKKGRRPSFVNALNPHDALDLYEYFNAKIEERYDTPATGIFGADMKVASINDGPFTVILDSKELWG